MQQKVPLFIATLFLSAVYGGALPVPAAGFGSFGVQQSSERRLESRCRFSQISGQFSATGAQYQSAGICDIFYVYVASGKEEYYDQIKWEAVGTYAAIWAEETISLLRLVRPDQPNYLTIGKITAKMKCQQDPWLNPPYYGCTDLFYGRSESLNTYNLDALYAKNRSLPRTAILSAQQRTALNKQYQASIATYQQYNPGARRHMSK